MSNIPGDPVNPFPVDPNPDNPDRAVVVGAGGDFVVTLSKEPGSSAQFLSRQGKWVAFGTTELTSWGNIVGDIQQQDDLQAEFALYTPTTGFAAVAFTGQYASLLGLPILGDVSAINTTGGTSAFLRADGTWAIPVDVNAEWGNIGGNINAQNDLMIRLNLKADINNQTMTGFFRVPTPPVDDSTDLAINSGWFMGQAFNGNPQMDGVVSSGDSTRWARGNHRHPTDTTLAPIDSPLFTGNPRAPTVAFPNATVSIATTAFVTAAVAGAGGIPEAPSDGKLYARKNGAWIAFTPGALWDNTGA